MLEPLGTCKHINRQTRLKQKTWIPGVMAMPENATLHICGRKQGLRKVAEAVEQKVVPKKPPKGWEAIRQLLSQMLK